MPLGSCLSVHLRLLRVAHRVVQQGHLRVRKLEKFLDGRNVHRHARAGHQAHAGTEQINILAHDASIGSHRHLRAGVAAAELGLVCNDENADRGRLRPILTVGNERPVVTLRHLLQRVFLVVILLKNNFPITSFVTANTLQHT